MLAAFGRGDEKAVDTRRAGQRAEAYLNSTAAKRNEVDASLSCVAAESV